MFFLVVGEGNSDVGADRQHPGPLMHALIALAKEVSDEILEYDIISRSRLRAEIKGSRRNPKRTYTRGKKNPVPGYGSLTMQAEQLAMIAMTTIGVGAVFFHDCDFSAAEPNPDRFYREQIKSIERGFKRARFKNGVAMVPKTRSECWLLCHYQQTPYVNCARFENIGGSDHSKKSGKTLLAETLGCAESEIYTIVKGEEINWSRIDCPSFNFFKNRFKHVVERLLHRPTTLQENETLMLDE